MAAPTPVSALVHSSTLVTAGVFLLIRLYPTYASNASVHGALLCVGAVTAVLAGMAAFYEFDFKKVVAYSTLSQLGVIVRSLGLGLPSLAFFHLLTHAMFKALLFVCVGALIDQQGHAQDLRSMGGLIGGGTTLQGGLLVANVALCGIPFLRGFYSKDAILEHGFVAGRGWLCLGALVVGTAYTTSYSLRAIGVSHISLGLQGPVLRSPALARNYCLPVVFLGGMSLAWGSLLNWVLVPLVPVAGVSELSG